MVLRQWGGGSGMAVSRVLLPHLRVFPFARPGRAARRFAIGFLFGILAVLGGLAGFRQAYADPILPGGVVRGGDVGATTPAWGAGPAGGPVRAPPEGGDAPK